MLLHEAAAHELEPDQVRHLVREHPFELVVCEHRHQALCGRHDRGLLIPSGRERVHGPVADEEEARAGQPRADGRHQAGVHQARKHGNDHLEGNFDNDVLGGGNGNDYLEDNLGQNQFFVANTGGDTVLDLRISFQGGFGQLISFQNAATRKVGLNPTSAKCNPAVGTGTRSCSTA